MQNKLSGISLAFRWSPIKPLPGKPLPRSRSRHSSCRHGDCIYVIGGKDGRVSLKDVWKFYIGSGEWEKLSLKGDCPSYLEGHTLVSHKKNLVLFGGSFGDDVTDSALWIINPGAPIPFTIAWVVTMLDLYQNSCWFPYYFLKQYWIIEAPRVAVIGVNLFFLLNIIRVLVHKLRKTRTLEPQVTKVRKAVKAAIVLLPLLGITNIVNLIDPPAESVVQFGLWSYSTYFLVSFQGFFISLLYCYLNGEVQAALKKHWTNYQESKSCSSLQNMKNRRSCSMVTSTFDLALNQRIHSQFNKKSPLIKMKSCSSSYTESIL